MGSIGPTNDLMYRKYVRYHSGIHDIPESEATDIEAVKRAFHGLMAADYGQFRHAFPTTHARTLGIVKGKLVVSDDLPSHLKQGIFAKGGEYPVVMRFNSQNHLVASPDYETQFRGCALKIFNVEGNRLPEGQGLTTQDFNFNSHASEHDLSDAKTAREIIGLRIMGIQDPEKMNKILNARPDAALQNGRLTASMAPAQTLPFYSQVPYRFGDYMGKHFIEPATETMHQLYESMRVPKDSHDPNIVTKWVQDFFAQNEAVYEWKWQLCENIDEQPIEFAGTKWDQSKYPYQSVAKIIVPKQDCMDFDLKTFWEDHITMNTWKGLTAFEPLGGANRVRRAVYPFARAQREKYNSRKAVDVSKITELPGPLPEGIPL